MSDAIKKSTITGLVTVRDGLIVASQGAGDDSRVRTLVTDTAWIVDALKKRMVPILLSDRKLIAYVSEVADGHLVLLADSPSDTVLRFLMSVDFSYDIIEHVLTDPYDAMMVINTEEKIVFISPIHEKSFGLEPGEGAGRPIREVIPNTNLPDVVRTGVAEVGQILRMNGRDLIVSRHAIRHEGEIAGAIGRVMFKGPEQLEKLARRVNDLEQQIAQYKADSIEASRGERFLDAIIGQSMAIRSIREQIRKVAPLDVPVLIQGESGTGKELVARALHMMSPRRDARLVTVNAAALPATLVESELFGYAAGSFTGADRKGRAGKFELADGGTIFLDEIGDMPIEVQSKLLRVLQDRVVERVGGDKATRVDFRLCSATNRDLEAFIEQNKFRLDLFYRISPVTIMLPTLEERIEDLPLLLHHFVQEIAEKYGRSVPEVALNLPDYLMERRWPGNVRQLRHEVERAFVFSEQGRLTIDDFRRDESQSAAHRPAFAGLKSAGGGDGGTIKDAVDQLERTMISDAMVRFKGNKKRVAESLGVSRSYLYKKLGDELGEVDDEDEVEA
jgi:transcriptional regulator with PAS, ATPase and Fis domain